MPCSSSRNAPIGIALRAGARGAINAVSMERSQVTHALMVYSIDTQKKNSIAGK